MYGHGLELIWDKFPTLAKYGTDGVTIFFVLSGFLIGRILIRTFGAGASVSSLTTFWVRRWFRTLPAYFVTLLMVTCAYVYRHHAAYGQEEAARAVVPVS